MAFSRYEERFVYNNQNELYRNLFDERGVNFVRQYTTPEFKYPSLSEFSNLEIEYRAWRVGDRYSKLSELEYGNPEYWWVLAWFNKAPTEAHLVLGQQVLIPKPLETILGLLGL